MRDTDALTIERVQSRVRLGHLCLGDGTRVGAAHHHYARYVQTLLRQK
jgi:hypothetical protein